MYSEQGASSFGSGQKSHLAQPSNCYGTADTRDNYLPVSKGCEKKMTERVMVPWDIKAKCSKDKFRLRIRKKFLRASAPTLQRFPQHVRGHSLTKDPSYGETYCRAQSCNEGNKKR